MEKETIEIREAFIRMLERNTELLEKLNRDLESLN